MKILIISIPRTGSTSLLERIATEKKLKPIFEPFDGTNRVLYKNEDNIVVKSMVFQHQNNFELAKDFDEIILLSRKNINDCIESHSYHVFFSIKNGYKSTEHYKYVEPPEDVVFECKTNIIKWNEQIFELSEKLNIPISYYEDLFDINSSDRLRIKEDIKKDLI